MNIEQRLQRLERQNRRLKWIGGVALVAIATTLFLGARANNFNTMSKAHAFVIHDLQGNMRGSLAVDGRGEPALTLFDKNAKPRAIFSFIDNKDQACVAFQDDKGDIQIVAASKAVGKAEPDAK